MRCKKRTPMCQLLKNYLSKERFHFSNTDRPEIKPEKAWHSQIRLQTPSRVPLRSLATLGLCSALPSARTGPTPSSSHSPHPSSLGICQPQSDKLGFALNSTNLAPQHTAPAVPTPASRAAALGKRNKRQNVYKRRTCHKLRPAKPSYQRSCARSYQHRRCSQVFIFNHTKSAYFSDQLIETPTSSGCQQGKVLFFTQGAEPIINNTKTFVKKTVLSTAYSLEASLLHWP